MVKSRAVLKSSDPSTIPWATISLPDTWPDKLDLGKPADLWKIIKHIWGNKCQRVQLPDNLPGKDLIPKYVLQEFHNLPNGNYSKKLTRGYISSFDHVMLGEMEKARDDVARALQGKRSVLDVGCAGGAMAGVLKHSNVDEVWAMDPSAYLLQHAAKSHPAVNFVLGVAEDTPFPDQRFDGISACFLFHEIPPKYTDASFAEFNRILKPGGVVAVCEPSDVQARGALWSMFKQYGFKGFYFAVIARMLYEPFLQAWHNRDINDLLPRHGFELLADNTTMPVRHIVARKCL